jgi:hypothetical protein
MSIELLIRQAVETAKKALQAHTPSLTVVYQGVTGTAQLEGLSILVVNAHDAELLVPSRAARILLIDCSNVSLECPRLIGELVVLRSNRVEIKDCIRCYASIEYSSDITLSSESVASALGCLDVIVNGHPSACTPWNRCFHSLL